MSPDRDQTPLSKPPRSALTLRDMVVALAIMVPIILALAGLTRSCSFSPGGPSVDDSRLPVVDAPAELATIARTIGFPVRVPPTPAGWRSNSVDQDRVAQDRVAPADAAPGAASRSVRAGYLTPQDHYLRLVQTDAAEEALLATEAGSGPVSGTGTQDAGGLRWVGYGRDGGEPIWIAELPGTEPVRALITGSGTDDDFRTLAAAVAAAPVAPRGS